MEDDLNHGNSAHLISKHVVITLMVVIYGIWHLFYFSELLSDHFRLKTAKLVDEIAAYTFIIGLLFYTRKLLYGNQPKYKIIIGSVVLGYALIWLTLFLLKTYISGLMVMH